MSDPNSSRAPLELQQLADEFESAANQLRAQRESLLGLLRSEPTVLPPPATPDGLVGVEGALRARDLQLEALDEELTRYLQQAKQALARSRQDREQTRESDKERSRLLEALGAEQDRALNVAEVARRAQERLHQAERELQTVRAQQDHRLAQQEAADSAHRTTVSELATLRQSLELARQELQARAQRQESVDRWLEQERQRANELETSLRLAQDREQKASEHSRQLELRLTRVELERDNATHEAQSRQAASERAESDLQRLQAESARTLRTGDRELTELRAENLRLRKQALRVDEVEEELRQVQEIKGELEAELGRRRAQLTDLAEQLAEASGHEAEAYKLRLELEACQQQLALLQP